MPRMSRRSRASCRASPTTPPSLDDLRRALIQTSLVSAVEVKPVPGSEPGTVDIAVKLEPAPPRTIAGELGYGTGEGARAELSWTHRNLFPPEGALTLRGGARHAGAARRASPSAATISTGATGC